MNQNRKRTEIKKNWLLLLTSLLLYLLPIYGSIGLVVTILLIVNGRLPTHISTTEYIMLMLALFSIIPVYLWHKRVKSETKTK